MKTVKIKFDLGFGEIKNCWANIKRADNHYELRFTEGSYDLWVMFNPNTRTFYGT